MRSSASGQCIIIGAGSIGLRLIQLLSRDLDLVCIDRDEARLTAATKVRSAGLTTLAGDATSRLVLEEAGVEAAEMVVITTTGEKVTLEVARVLHDHFRSRRVIAVGITLSGIETLESLGVDVVGVFSLTAIELRNRVEHKAKAVQGIGLGKNEILEVEVHPHSRLANKPLAALNPKSWRVGIIYREGNIIIPKGDTAIRPKDRVILLGDPKVLKTVTDLLTFRFTHFPREYGDTLTAWVDGREPAGYLEEIGYLLSVFPLERALFVLPRALPEVEARLRQQADRPKLKVEFAYEDAPPLRALESVLKNRVRRTSMVVMPHQAIRPSPWPGAGRRVKNRLRQLVRLVGCPVLLAAGTFPYERVAVPCIARPGLQHALETTLEMSSAISYAIEALFVRLSPYISVETELRDFEEMRKTISDLGLIYKSEVRTVDLQGNPVKAVLAGLRHNLQVMDVGGWRSDGPLAALVRPDPSWEVARRSPVSVLLIPSMETIV